MRKSLFVFRPFGMVVCIILACITSIPMLTSQCPSGVINGTVFLDKDLSGVKSATEIGESGVFVRVYDAAGAFINETLSANDGSYSIPNLVDGSEYMVTFEIPSSYYLSTSSPDAGSDVQFVTSPNCAVDLGVLDNNSNCSETSEIILSCFANSLSPDYNDQETLIGLAHNFQATTTAKVYAKHKDTGPVWGLGFNDNNEMIYSAAFVKQHSQLTEHGHDAIFVTDVTSSPKTTLFAKLSDLGQAVGSLDYTDANNCNYGKQVGTIGLGALSFNDSKDRLFVANLYNNTIVKLRAENPTASTTQAFTVPDPGCANADYRIFAIEHFESALYIGVTCTGETSGDPADMSFHVYKFKFETETFSLEFSTDYTKGVWNVESTGTKYNQQWLTDIDFTEDGNMLLGISDRFGHTYCNGTTSRVDDQKGDILMVENVAGTWVLESNGKTSKLNGSGIGNGQGPDGGEFFGDDYFELDPSDHPDVALGSLFVMPGTNEVVTAVFDPELNTYSGGLHRYSTINGQKVGSKELYSNDVSNFFGKATGFGNIISRCGSLFPEVGNLVWSDDNCDGLQNANEKGLANITLNIYDSECNLVGTTVTNAEGKYAFTSENIDRDNNGRYDGLVVDETYYITIDPSTFIQPVQSFIVNDVYYSLTDVTDTKQINSDAVAQNTSCAANDLSLIPTVKFLATAGVNTGLDIGLKASTDFDLALTKKQVSTKDIKYGDLITFELKVYNQGGVVATEYELTDYLTPAFKFDAADNPGWVKVNNQLKKVVTTPLPPSRNHTELLKLRINTRTNIANYINYAEISYAKNQHGELAVDVDSKADDIKNNDKGGDPETTTDDLYTDDGTIDEDDHDPAIVKVLDLALRNVIQDNRKYDVGDMAIFEMTVLNQGNVAVTEFEVTNLFPVEMTFVESQNDGWIVDAQGKAKYTYKGDFLPGDRETIFIKLNINDAYNYEDILNLAEISRMVSANPEVTRDIDSTPDDFLFNDNGGSPYDATDNLVTDNGTIDEDDHDPAILSVRKIDLALQKTTNHLVYNPGDLVEFKISIFNQGEVAVGKVKIVDYLPEHTILEDEGWLIEKDDLTGNTVFKNIEFANGFNPGETHVETINLRVADDILSGYVINHAEIAAVFDRSGVDISDGDIDSKPDSDLYNDNGGIFSSRTDDLIDDDGNLDEDDADPSGFYIADAFFTRQCNCLSNATNIFNGQFIDTLRVKAPAGQTWYIDQVNNLFSATSPAPPAALVPFVTGSGGYELEEVYVDSLISEYLLIGKYEDGNLFNVRVTNGDGAYLQALSAGKKCQYDREVIVSPTNGLSAVCSATAHNYRVEGTTGCDDYTWSLSGGGTILGPNDRDIVRVQWNAAAGGPYVLTLTPNCPDMCLSPIQTEISVGDPSTIMSCVGSLNVSLNNYCSSQMDAGTFLTSATMPNEAYQLMMTDEYGAVIPNNLLTEQHLWTTVMAKITDPCSGNSCWSTVHVEDKNAPTIQCGDISLPCNLMNTYEPLIIENCHEEASYELIAESIQPLSCDPNFIKTVTRTYVAKDGYGNVSEPCEQVISLERIPLAEIEYPQNFLLDDETNLTCVDSIYNEDGSVKIEIAGVPMLNGYPIYPVQDFYCNVGIEYEDFVVAEFGCIKKIMRTWRVYESWCTTGVLADPYVQTIEIADTESPVVTCPQPVTVSSSGPNCEATVSIDLPTITDDCSTSFNINLSYDGGFVRNVKTTQNVVIASGISKAKFYVYDQCENLDSCTVNIEVLDLSNPVAVCDENTIVSLRSTGTAKAFAHTFDDGSYDDCSLFKTLVKRVDTPCDCDRPEFENMNFLGEREGKFYYLSKFKTHGSKAFSYSEAYGGAIVKFETEAEYDWVHDKTKALITSPYYIGLTDADHQGRFTWSDHSDPTFNKFEGGAPVNVGDNVVTNTDGDWVVVDGVDVEAYYILELGDACGFSDEIYFCCPDVVEEQMVVFRVVDYFGRVNECMVNVEVQDKVAPKITCPESTTISCTIDINIEDLSVDFGVAEAVDQCGAIISDTLIDMRNGCAQGDLIRRFTASDNNGFSTCDQIITVINDIGTVDNTITWPLDFTTDMGCNSMDLDPDSLAVEYGRPQFAVNNCNQLVVSYSEQRFSFAGPQSDACLKILRRWTVIDWCQRDEPNYEPATHDQVIKVNNTMGPEILTGCDTLNVFTEQCLRENVSFSATAEDDCTPGDELRAMIQIDTFSDGLGDFDIEVKMTNGEISFNDLLPIGKHFALISFTDQCNNVTTCTKIINVTNITIPTAACVDGITVALEPMDLDGNGTPDTERACIFPEMIDASSTHTCGTDINLSFSADTADDKRIYECVDIGIQTIQLWVTDAFGNTAFCEAHVDVQDNNNEDFCPRFDLALTKKLNTTATPGPFYPGDDVSFTIEVFNQGNIMAFNIGLVDYIPEGLELNDNNWTANGAGTLATLNDNILNIVDSTSTTVDINFKIADDFMGFSITNVAEISEADNDQDPNNTLLEDGDSTPDTINDDVIGGDNEINNTNGDEDDHDPEVIAVEQTFDLSLAKDCSTDGPYMPGSTITYILTVTNEGTVNALNVELEDSVPAGLILADSDWTQSGSVATLNTPVPLVAVGQSVDVEITFTIDDMFMNASIDNTAQIIDPQGLLLEDVDSTPGNDDGDQSEDDEAAKRIVVGQVFDLALVKLINTTETPGPYDTGDNVAFTVTVYNQGSLDATNVQVVDYVPTGMTFNPILNTDFNVSGSNAVATVSVDSDESLTLDLVLTINDNFAGNSLINTAEIIAADNALGLEDQDDDLDNVNTGGTNPEIGSNNDIDDERPGTPGTVDNPNDEDDYDLEVVDVNCTLTPICNSLSSLEVFLDANGMANVTSAMLDNGSVSSCTNETVIVSITSNNASFNCLDIGSGNIVTLQAVDSNGNVSTNDCQTDVTVTDNTAPSVTCTDVTVSSNSAGEPILVASDIVTISNDNCVVVDTTISLVGIDFNLLQCTPDEATLIVVDQSGNSESCTFMITISNDPPVAICNTPITLQLDANGDVSLTTAEVNNNSTDDCSMANLVFDLSETAFDCSDVGTTSVVLTVTDEAGSSDTCTASITIEDNVPPIANCQNITAELGANGMVGITAIQINDSSSDACGVLNVSLDILSFECDDMGDQTVILTVTDNNDNTDTCEATVTVEDNIDPTVECVASMDVSLDANGMASVTVDQYIMSSDDNCGIVTMTASQTDAFDCEDIDDSPISVTVTVADEAGNEATCISEVTIVDDISPVCNLTGNTVDIAALATITLQNLGYSASDNCTRPGVLRLSAVIDPISFDCSFVGETETVTVTVTDEAGNTSTCTASVTIFDDTEPVCIAQDITVDLRANGTAVITPQQVDNGSTSGCDDNPTLMVTPNMFDCSQAGTDVPVVLTITSSNGASDSCDATVTVRDVRRPRLMCATDTTFSIGNGTLVITPSDLIYSVTDNCGMTTLTTDIAMFTCAMVDQVTGVTVTATDLNGNTATCLVNVTPIDDVAPTCELIDDITISPNQVITIPSVLSTSGDNCDMNLDFDLDQNVFTCMELGTNTITVTVTDDSGNTGTCQTDIEVEDIVTPVCQSFTSIIVYLDINGEAEITPADVDSMSFTGCSDITLTVSPDFFACNDVDAANVATLTVTDEEGDFSTCTTQVTVLDTISPVINCATLDTLLFLDDTGNVSFNVADLNVTATDGCDLDGIVLDVTSLDCSDKGTPTTVTATATDENDNSASCTITVNVDDNLAPECTLFNNLTLPPNVIITESTVLQNFTDNCATVSSNTTITPNIFDCDELGTNAITVVVTDDCGNTGSCTTEVEIVDNSMPICMAQDITVSLTNAGNAVITAADVDNGSSAACGNSVTLSVTPTVFNCTNLGDNLVTLTVMASGGDSASCTATVTIVDDLPPTLVCPADQTIPCNSDISNLDQFGDPTASDNCDPTPSISASVEIDVNACNVGTVIRTFTATDNLGNTSSCMQTITIDAGTNPIVEANITWPTSPFTITDCIPDVNDIDSGLPIVDTSNADCFNVSIGFEDFGNNGNACSGSFTRTWTVIDSCQIDGVFTFNQLIVIDDNTGPDVSGPMDMTIILAGGTCDTFLNLPATVTDCAPGFTAVNDSPYADSNVTADASGTYSVGETLVNVTGTDACGNDSIYTYSVNVIDTSIFIVDCAKIIASMDATMMVEIPITSANTIVESESGCNVDNIYTFSFSGTDPTVDVIIADCSFIGFQNYTVYVYSGTMLIDSCTNLLQIVDGGGFCTSPSAGTIVGDVFTEDNRMVENVSVELLGAAFEDQMTDNEGAYAFPEMSFGGSYMVKPTKDVDYLNGVSTLDLIGIQRHIVGTERLDSPYKLIAADVDNSGKVTSVDLLELRKLILGIYNKFPDNTSWRMVDSDYTFVDAQDPFAFDYPEEYEIFNFNQSMEIDFVGVKIGDVNNSAVANAKDLGVSPRSSRDFTYKLSERKYKAGSIVTLQFTSEDLNDVSGLQNTFEIDTDKADVMAFNPLTEDMSVANINNDILPEGILNMSWFKSDAWTSNDVDGVFEVVLRIKEDSYTSDLVNLSQAHITPEAYYDGQVSKIDIEFIVDEEADEVVSLYQNSPNPWSDNTEIKFYMPSDQDVVVNIYDINGKLIYQQQNGAKKGVNRLLLNESDFPSGGILYYELISGGTRLMNKMLLIK